MGFKDSTMIFDHATLAARLDKVRENAPVNDPATGVAARTLIDNYRKLTVKDDGTTRFRRENRKIVVWKMMAVAAELTIYPETTLAENSWTTRCPVIVATSQPGIPPETHRRMVSSLLVG